MSHDFPMLSLSNQAYTAKFRGQSLCTIARHFGPKNTEKLVKWCYPNNGSKDHCSI